MTDLASLDAARRRRSPATMPGFHCGRPPRNKDLRYPADPPAVEEIVAVMRTAGETTYGLRTRALVVVLWPAGLRISEALALAESDLDRSRGSVLIRHGRAASDGRSAWTRSAWEQIDPWLRARVALPVGALLCVIDGPTEDGRGHRRPLERPCARSASARAFAGASRRISCATHTRSRWHAKVCPSRSYSVSSATRTSA
jgi:site-specific recombinase XerC